MKNETLLQPDGDHTR